MSQQGARQAAARLISSSTTNNTYNEDLRLAFEGEITVPPGATFNEAQLLWINSRLGVTFTNINEAMQAFADSENATNWSSLGVLEIPGVPPSNTVPPVVSGSLTVGSTLSCTTGTWAGDAPISYGYQWVNSVSGDIGGATAATYDLQASDLGDNIECTVTATNPAGSASQASNSVGPVVAVAQAWNPSDKAAAVTLSNSDRTATVVSGGSSIAGVRSVTPHATGKWHFEVTLNVTSGAYPGFGVGNSTASLAQYIGINNNSIGYFVAGGAGDIYQNNAVVASIGAFTTGTFAVEVDADARTIYFQRSGGSRNGPYSIAATGNLYAFFTGLQPVDLIINTGQAAFAITPTSGFTAWG